MYILLTLLMAIGAATVISGADKYLIGLLNKKKNSESELPSTRNHSIDFMRIVMAFLVVTIHLPFAGKAGNVFITFGKTAVPFFLVICGYMLYRDGFEFSYGRKVGKTALYDVSFAASFASYLAACIYACARAFGLGASDRKYELPALAGADAGGKIRFKNFDMGDSDHSPGDESCELYLFPECCIVRCERSRFRVHAPCIVYRL